MYKKVEFALRQKRVENDSRAFVTFQPAGKLENFWSTAPVGFSNRDIAAASILQLCFMK